MKKQIFLLLGFFLFASSLIGQNRSYLANPNPPKNRKMPADVGSLYFELGIRCFPEITSHFTEVESFSPNNIYSFSSFLAPSINATVLYKLRKKISLGGFMSYGTESFQSYTTFDGKLLTKERGSYFALAPVFRYDWTNREKVNLYSSVALGLFLQVNHNRTTGQRNTTFMGLYDFTYLGIRIGKSWYGFGELSASNTGFFEIGIGYQLKKRR